MREPYTYANVAATKGVIATATHSPLRSDPLQVCSQTPYAVSGDARRQSRSPPHRPCCLGRLCTVCTVLPASYENGSTTADVLFLR